MTSAGSREGPHKGVVPQDPDDTGDGHGPICGRPGQSGAKLRVLKPVVLHFGIKGCILSHELEIGTLTIRALCEGAVEQSSPVSLFKSHEVKPPDSSLSAVYCRYISVVLGRR